MNLGAAGVELDSRGNIKVDQFLQTTAAHIFAAGDVTGRLMLVPGAIEDGFVAATNAIQGPTASASAQGDAGRQLHASRICGGGAHRGEGARDS